MLKVTENWSARTLSLRWPWTATREFVVTGAATETEALTAVDALVPSLAIPQRNDGHPYNTDRLTCDGPAVKKWYGNDHWDVVCSYTADDGDKSDGQQADPLQEPVKIKWSSVIEGRASDFDLGNRPILSSAGQNAGTMDLPIRFKRLTIVKNFPFYDIILSETYENAVNSQPVNFAGVVTAAAHHMVCEAIEPAIEFTPNAAFVPVAFNFLMIFDNSLGNYPFQHRMLDAGTEGWFASTGTNKSSAPFLTRDKPNDPLSHEIRLDGTGIPLTAPYKGSIGVNGKTGPVNAVTPPTATAVFKREYYDNNGTLQSALDNNTVAVFNYFQRTRVADFTPLLALL